MAGSFRHNFAWGQLGLFSGTMCFGCAAGAVAWGAVMRSNQLYFDFSDPGVGRQRFLVLFASKLRFYAVFLILYACCPLASLTNCNIVRMYGFQFLCLILSKHMLLGRLADSASQSSRENVAGMSEVRRRWTNGRGLLLVYSPPSP